MLWRGSNHVGVEPSRRAPRGSTRWHTSMPAQTTPAATAAPPRALVDVHMRRHGQPRWWSPQAEAVSYSEPQPLKSASRSQRRQRGQPGPGAGRDRHTAPPPRAEPPAAQSHGLFASSRKRHAHGTARAHQVMSSSTVRSHVTTRRMPLIGECGLPAKAREWPALHHLSPCHCAAFAPMGSGPGGAAGCAGGLRAGGTALNTSLFGRAPSISPPAPGVPRGVLCRR